MSFMSFVLNFIPILNFTLQLGALLLNASRRFRCTLDLKKDQEQEQISSRMIRAHSEVIRVSQNSPYDY